MPEHPDDVAESIGAAYWSVDEGRWETLAPNLPDHCVDLLAPPILVGAAPCRAEVAAPDFVPPSGDDRTPTALDRLDMLVPAPRETTRATA
ncbi:hypothetical protein O7635_00190 [Asanoa sp. WMMD1127]|uniref:hypothetical protein n=1 Tax=Asanoa sp. WMMD1127 TaxID=3016107 RepID=UPI002416247A|nr:hypothetical protein [Asanoa sp. WMMD1127]MDG4820290.1 hypothetical protein [Asanoa sp. WMMD1127]